MDDYVEEHDRKQGWEEEMKLWGILGEEPEEHSPALLPDEIPKPPFAHKDLEDIKDWREGLHYRSEWEVYDEPIAESAFESNRCRHRQPNSYTDSQTDSKSDGLEESDVAM